jgi:hypothetical protein
MTSNRDPIGPDAESGGRVADYKPDIPVAPGASALPLSQTPHRITGNPGKDWWDKTKPFAEMAGIALLAVYTGYTIMMYYANKEAADAAKKAADTASKQLELAQRPWLSWQDLKLTSAFIFDNEGARVGMQALIKNSGNSPAVAVTIDSEIFLGDPDPAIDERERFCKGLSGNKPTYGQTVFPSTTTQEFEWARVKTKDLNARASPGLGHGRIIGPNIITCIAYRSTFDSTARYYTGAILTVSRSTPENPRLSLVITVGENVPLERLIFSFLPVGAIVAK